MRPPVQSVALDAGGEVRVVEHGRTVAAASPAGRVIRSTLEPGWRWSRSVGPTVGAEYRTAPHLG